jgi:iron complex outermembrane receptor protein
VLGRVEITGSRVNGTELRRQATAATLVITRDEIESHGDGSVTDVLKRLPGVQIGGGGRHGRGGEIRMRGLGGGYTQIQLNGERMPPGFSLDSLSPDQIERIELTRGPTAETGARAVAGTVNIILRDEVRQRLNTLNLGIGREQSDNQTSASWTRADQHGAFSYNVSGSVMRTARPNASSLHTTGLDAQGTPNLDRTEVIEGDDLREGLHLSGRLNWKLSGTDSLSLNPMLIVSRSQGQSLSSLSQTPTSTLAAPFDQAELTSRGHYGLGRLSGQWNTRLAGDSRLEVRAGLSRGQIGSDSRRILTGAQASATQPQTVLDNQTRIDDTGWTTGGKLSRTLDAEHQLAMGWETESSQRSESAQNLRDGQAQLPDFGADLGASTRRLALWLQDEWSPAPQWSFQAGWRWESIDTHSSWQQNGQDAQIDNRSRVGAPMLHMVWRPDQLTQDQVRASLTRSYRSPTLQNLIARPSLSGQYPVSGSNLASSPDRLGNPDLRPELASGLELAWEHYLSGNGLVSINFFHRWVEDTIRNVLRQETVSYSTQTRWVLRPENVGSAQVSGLELEFKARLSDLSPGAAPVDLRANITGLRSQLSGSSPDVRLDQQPRQLMNAGADYRLRSLPLKVGGTLNITPGYTVRIDDSQRLKSGLRTSLDAYGLWTFAPDLALRLSVANLMPRDQLQSGTVVDATGSQSVETVSQGWTNVSLRLEMKF